jgi:signal transduction histidine kinase
LLVGFAQVTTLVSLLWRHNQSWWYAPAGAAATALALVLAPTLRRWHDRWTPVLLAPTEAARLARRVARLTETRADAVDTQAAELRRIERDLHDGAQGRLVAMGMALRTVERLLDVDPETARKLIVEVRENTATALTEIRELVHGIHPPVLAERGLADAIRVVALDSPLDVEVAADLPGRLDPPVESAAYFAVRELLTNAAKHSGASHVRVSVHHADELLRIHVHDDGHGGADPAGGTGLLGLRKRLGTFDGVLEVLSPVGGPTTLTMEIPCVLSSRRTSTSSGPG